MNLKDAFRYQKHLGAMLNTMNMYLTNRDNVMTTTIEHLRKKANPDAEDETLVNEAGKNSVLKGFPVAHIIGFYTDVAEERFGLTEAIEDAKRGYKPVMYDAALAMNRTRQDIASTLRIMSNMKSNGIITPGYDYKFNVNGDQVRYCYDTKTVTTIDFDRNAVKKLAKQYTEEANAVSDLLDHALLDIQVVFEPIYSPDDSLEESMEIYAKAHPMAEKE